jgi:hypothetical protein
VGKTRVAIEYAWHHYDDYTALLFLSAETASELRTNLEGLAIELGTLVEGTTAEHQLADVVRWLDSHPG